MQNQNFMLKYNQRISIWGVVVSYFKKIPSETHEGKIVYNNGILDNIVILAVSEIDGAEVFLPHEGDSKSAKKSVKVKQEKDGIYVSVDVVINASLSVPDMAFKIQENIKHNVEAMTGYHITNVDITVQGVIFDDEHKDNKTVEEPVEEELETKDN